MATLDQFDHPAWYSIVGMAASYIVMLVAITVVFFLLPYLVFMAL